MKSFRLITAISLLSSAVVAQNDIDAIRYSQTFFGGTSRNKAMAGSFGALGADGSCMAINPAGIGLYRKGDMNISFGLKFMAVEGMHNGTSTKNFNATVPFDGLSLVGAWDSKINPDNHHALGLSLNQIANYNANTTIEGRANGKSMMDEVLLSAKGLTPDNLDPSYAGLAFSTYVLDTLGGKYYSFVNSKKDVLQSKTIETSGKINEWCINYAYGYKDKLYMGVTLGIPNVTYNHNSVYKEIDDKDSIKINNYDYPVYYYSGNGGFKSFSYQEAYKTTGNGYNLKLGIIYRAADFIRLGASFNSPTIYNLTDSYVYNMESNFDEGGHYQASYPPDNGGRFNYKVITPMKFTGSIALLYKKIGTVNVDYDVINYKQASLQSNPSDFTGVNTTIRNKYAQTSNLRVGGELNLKPIFVRAGYAMYGSPFGDTFNGDFVTSFYTGGIGFRLNKFYMDFSFVKSLKNENYYMYNANFVDKSTLKNSGTTIALSIGSKF